MTNMDSLAVFLYDLILTRRAISITFANANWDPDVPNTIYWQSNPQADGTHVGVVQAPYQIYNQGEVPWNKPLLNNCSYSAFNTTLLANRL